MSPPASKVKKCEMYCYEAVKTKCKLIPNLVALELPLIFISPFNRFKIYIPFDWFDPENNCSINVQKCIPLLITEEMLASICVISEVCVRLHQKGYPLLFWC